MEMRYANESDISSIVSLLKESLGEQRMAKSETYWRWKHVDNPFGRSPVLIAEEGGMVVGVRAFMRWEWNDERRVYRTVRAVDTATHPAYQGKGIFRTLTLKLVDQCQRDGLDFIFNTPNEKSKPGYLKMGWSSVGRMNINLRPLVNFRRRDKDFEITYAIKEEQITRFFEGRTFFESGIRCHHSAQSILWRYRDIPNLRYFMVIDDSHLSFFRLRPFRFGIEFRVCDSFSKSGASPAAHKKLLLQAARRSGSCIISSAGNSYFQNGLQLNLGPEVTLRNLTLQNSLSFGVWYPSLGDMEVF